jgi:hypothetical protein
MDEINIDAYMARIRASLMSGCVIKIIDPATQQEEEIRPPSRRTSVSMLLVPPPSERDQYEIEIRRLEEALNRKRAEYNNRFLIAQQQLASQSSPLQSASLVPQQPLLQSQQHWILFYFLFAK